MTTAVPMPPLGPRRPVVATPARARPSVRRTTTIDSTQGVGPDGTRLLVVDARGRDAVTHADGRVEVADVASFTAVLEGPLRTLVEIAAEPARTELAALVGVSTYSGFRKALATIGPTSAPEGSLLHLLLDDLVGAALVAGYGEVQSGAFEVSFETSEATRARLEFQRDLCAGWAAEGGMMQSVEVTGTTPMPPSAPAPDLRPVDDPSAWHDVSPLAFHATRRRRRLDVVPADDGAVRYDVHFRDTHAVEADVEGIIHEYTLGGELRDGRLASVAAAAHVLPWLECPSAIGSERRAEGLELSEVRELVRRELRGTSTCTHLNDSLRSMADLGHLAALLPG
ncbi:MAG: DUF2889 domain-containing protein [Actinomycetota bacterium]|nr:DUF2889 domain-containing protein [Actinomycetota bacterium]